MAGYRIGLTIAPIMPVPEWRQGYGDLLASVADALADVPDLDLTVECITHRFTAISKDVLTGWYPKTKLEMDEPQSHAQVRQVRLGQVRLSEGHDVRAPVVVRGRTRSGPARRPPPVLDVTDAVGSVPWDD